MQMSRRDLLSASLLLAASRGTSAWAQPSREAQRTGGPAGPPGSFAVRTPDGLTLAAQAYGDPRHPEIVFIHGLRQSRLSWERQIKSQLATRFRIVTYDLRGHGDSDKPSDPAAYGDGKRWGDDLAAVVQAAKLRRPVLVGWSLGGLVIGHYLAAHGAHGIGGLNLVDAVVKFGPGVLTPLSASFGPKVSSPELAVRVQATADFLRACFARAPAPADFEAMLTYNGMVPVAVQQGIGRISTDGLDAAFARAGVPTLVTFGVKDTLVARAMAEHSVRTIPGAKLSVYDEAGHAPFFESPERFNRELGELAASTAARPQP